MFKLEKEIANKKRNSAVRVPIGELKKLESMVYSMCMFELFIQQNNKAASKKANCSVDERNANMLLAPSDIAGYISSL
ncbi:hypothetical protein ACQVTU_24195 [Bacillus cereus]|uniref:hypothetical protein n=1 Tax=Bacillus cereus TaxID=1396 RepID=UPI003D65300B